jgi:hypothetical protein
MESQNFTAEINAKYQIASKELQNLYKRSTMIEPLLQILEDIYSKEDDDAGIAPLKTSINEIKLLNSEIKTSLLNIKEKKSGPFQRIIKNKGENFDAFENRMDKLLKDLEVALIKAEQTAKVNSEKKKQQKEMAKNYANNNNYQSNYNEQPQQYSLTDNYYNNYNYNNNAAVNYNSNNYQEPVNYNYINTNTNNNDNSLDNNLSNQSAYLNVNESNIGNTENQIQTNDNTTYNNNNNNNLTLDNNQQQTNIQPPGYQESQENYNYPQDNSNQFYNTYSNPSQQYYYGTLTKNDNQQQPMGNYNQQQLMGNYNQQQNINNYNQNSNYQDMNNYNNQYQQNQQMMYNDNNQIQMQQQQMQQQMQQQQMQQQQMQQQQMQQQMTQNQVGSNEATGMEGDPALNQKGLIPPTQYFAISSFTPRQPDELAIEQGDEVIIVQTFDDGWAFGRNSRTRMVGVLPMTFLSSNNQYNNYQYSNTLPDRQSSRRV